MHIDRRDFVRLSGVAVGVSWLSSEIVDAQQAPGADVPPSIRALGPMIAGIVPIGDDERQARIEKARRLMVENRIDAIFLESGSSLFRRRHVLPSAHTLYRTRVSAGRGGLPHPPHGAVHGRSVLVHLSQMPSRR